MIRNLLRFYFSLADLPLIGCVVSRTHIYTHTHTLSPRVLLVAAKEDRGANPVCPNLWQLAIYHRQFTSSDTTGKLQEWRSNLSLLVGASQGVHWVVGQSRREEK